jgi:hypothetical protein
VENNAGTLNLLRDLEKKMYSKVGKTPLKVFFDSYGKVDALGTVS